MPKELGFTLIEILVSIAVITVAGITILPNLISFNSDQQLKNISSELKNTIKNASSKASSNIKCNDTKASSAWTVTITNNPVAFSMGAICDDLSTSAPIYQSTLTQSLTITASSCNGSYPIVLNFQPGLFSYKCNSQASVSGDFTLTLKENQNNQTTTVTVTRGGVISEQ